MHDAGVLELEEVLAPFKAREPASVKHPSGDQVGATAVVVVVDDVVVAVELEDW